MNRNFFKPRILEYGALCALIAGFYAYMLWMPGSSLKEFATETNPVEQQVAAKLQEHVKYLSDTIGGRSVKRFDNLQAAAHYIEQQFQQSGYQVRRMSYKSLRGYEYENLEVELVGANPSAQPVVVGAHYDSVGQWTPGADDNASGVAALLLLAERLREKRPAHTIRFVAFTNEEPPFFQTEDMGSYRYLQDLLAKGTRPQAMLSLEMLGYYTDQPDTQHYPVVFSLFFPTRGNFVGFVGNLSSASFTRKVVGLFREKARIPSEGVAAPSFLPGIAWSDQWAFWKEGIPAVMVTDTSFLRNSNYHTEEDRWDTLDYPNFARAVLGLQHVLMNLSLSK